VEIIKLNVITCNLILIIIIFFIKDVEEITKKTGNFKKFSVFIEMLFSAIKMVNIKKKKKKKKKKINIICDIFYYNIIII